LRYISCSKPAPEEILGLIEKSRREYELIFLSAEGREYLRLRREFIRLGAKGFIFVRGWSCTRDWVSRRIKRYNAPVPPFCTFCEMHFFRMMDNGKGWGVYRNLLEKGVVDLVSLSSTIGGKKGAHVPCLTTVVFDMLMNLSISKSLELLEPKEPPVVVLPLGTLLTVQSVWCFLRGKGSKKGSAWEDVLFIYTNCENALKDGFTFKVERLDVKKELKKILNYKVYGRALRDKWLRTQGLWLTERYRSLQKKVDTFSKAYKEFLFLARKRKLDPEILRKELRNFKNRYDKVIEQVFGSLDYLLRLAFSQRKRTQLFKVFKVFNPLTYPFIIKGEVVEAKKEYFMVRSKELPWYITLYSTKYPARCDKILITDQKPIKGLNVKRIRLPKITPLKEKTNQTK